MVFLTLGHYHLRSLSISIIIDLIDFFYICCKYITFLTIEKNQ